MDTNKIEAIINLAEGQLILLPWHWFKERREMKRILNRYNKLLLQEYQKRIITLQSSLESNQE